MDKKIIILENLSAMPISEGQKNVIKKAIDDKDESKYKDKVVEGAYKYSMLITTNSADSTRGERQLKGLKNVCLKYVDEKGLDR